jgi:hypothetical protein
MPAKRRTPPKAAAAKKPAAKKKASPKKAAPTKVQLKPGLLDQTLVGNLKKAPKGVPPQTVVMQTLRAAAPDQLRAAFTKASPKERHAAFAALPGDQIKAIVGTLPVSVLGPSIPLAPAPSPTGGPPSTILTTSYENVPYPPAQTDPDWAQKISGGNTVGLDPNSLEWLPVYDANHEREGSLENPMVGLTGWVVSPDLSDKDVWFTHPFGNDFEFFVAPDPQYEGLLGAHNTGSDPSGNVTDTEYNAGTTHARDMGLPATKGVIGVETDQGLVPEPFQSVVQDKARVAAFGRWIVDCGHGDFHTEIHPPLLLAVAKPQAPGIGLPGASQMTHVEFMSRPYTVSQRWDDGNFVTHLLHEVLKVEDTFLGIPSSLRVEAHPTIFTEPYEGRPWLKLLVKPPVPRRQIALPQQKLTVAFHFTHRTGVAVQVYDAGNDTVGVVIVFGDLNPAKLPPKHDQTVSWGQLGDDYPLVIEGLAIADILTLNIAPAIILNLGILTDSYDAPLAQSPLDNQNIATPVAIDELHPGVGMSEDDAQPFPLYGWMNVFWQDVQVVAQGPPVEIG